MSLSDKVHNFFVGLVTFWITSGLWFFNNPLKILTGITIVFFLVTLSTSPFSHIKKVIAESKTIKWVSSLVLMVVLFKEFHGGFFGSFQRAALISLFLMICLKAKKTYLNVIYYIIITSIITNCAYVLYTYYSSSERPSEILNPNIYAPLFGVFTLFLIEEIKNKENRPTFYILIFSSLISLFIMHSRGVVVATLMSCALLLLIGHLGKITIKNFIITITLAAAALFIGKNEINRIYLTSVYEYETISSGSLSSSIGHRIQMLQVGKEMISRKPIFGHGDDFKVNRAEIIEKNGFSTQLNNYSTLHNVYVDSWVKTGVFGVVLFFFLTLVPWLSLKGGLYAGTGLALTLFTAIISFVDTALLGGAYALTLCLIVFYLYEKEKNTTGGSA